MLDLLKNEVFNRCWESCVTKGGVILSTILFPYHLRFPIFLAIYMCVYLYALPTYVKRRNRHFHLQYISTVTPSLDSNQSFLHRCTASAARNGWRTGRPGWLASLEEDWGWNGHQQWIGGKNSVNICLIMSLCACQVKTILHLHLQKQRAISRKQALEVLFLRPNFPALTMVFRISKKWKRKIWWTIYFQ